MQTDFINFFFVFSRFMFYGSLILINYIVEGTYLSNKMFSIIYTKFLCIINSEALWLENLNKMMY